MAFAGIAPPDPFLPTPGRPVQPWPRWHDMSRSTAASGASEFSPERRKALLLHSWDPKVNVSSILCLFRRLPKRRRRKGPQLRPTSMTPR
ncbi:hypothetical protein HPB50_010628 [Hyalomma asiaticum]|uniref:Uncharacterized protein n=1 Tax=Hyalomma asiaticum TaxID=266040 RepID=A0ACB7SGN6_HYAAI|nr:hypothetical protein HPB50_010628 [Hyalomma asiaticum]